MKKFSVSIRALSVFSTIVLLALFLPLIISGFYNRPIGDDLIQPYAAAVAWRETGSVFQTLLASLKETIRIWNDRSGIFTSMFVSVFAPYAFDYSCGFIHPILLSLLLVWACYRFAKCLHLISKEIPTSYIWLITVVLSIMLQTTMPSLQECYYWYSGAINYTCFFSLSLLLFACLVQSVGQSGACTTKNVFELMAYCVSFFLLGGTNWMTPTYSIVIYGLIALWIIYRNKPKRYLVPFLFLLAGFVLAVAAPGNANRQSVIGEKLPLWKTFFLSFRYAISFCIKNGRYYLISLLLLPVFLRLSRFMPKLPGIMLLVPVLSICILAAAYFPLIYSSYSVFARHETMVFFLFSVLLVINEALLMFWIAQRIPRLVAAGDRFCLPAVLACVAAVAVAVLSTHATTVRLNPLDIYSNYMPAKAAMHLMKGYTQNYAGSFDHLVDQIQNAQDGDLLIVDPSLQSPVLGKPDFLLDPDFYANRDFVKFFTDKDVSVTQPQN